MGPLSRFNLEISNSDLDTDTDTFGMKNEYLELSVTFGSALPRISTRMTSSSVDRLA